MPDEHAYGVTLEVHVRPDGRTGPATYRPYCECGWSGVLAFDETNAIADAYTHATGKPPEWLTIPRRRRQPSQSEAIFDGKAYDT